MIIFIDGDNSPGNKTERSNELDTNDLLTVVYAANNTYYKSDKNRQKLVINSGCTVNFHAVEAGSNAADLAIAMDAARTAEDYQRGIMVLVSDDKHIKIIASQLQKEYPDMFIVQVSTLGEAVDSYKILEVSSLQGLQQRLNRMFGERYGYAFYQKLRQLYLSEVTSAALEDRAPKHPLIAGLLRGIVNTFHI